MSQIIEKAIEDIRKKYLLKARNILQDYVKENAEKELSGSAAL
jgi:hypothetical protein